MINLEFTKHVHRTARRLWRERFSRPEVFGPEGAYSSLRECIESAWDAVEEYWQ